MYRVKESFAERWIDKDKNADRSEDILAGQGVQFAAASAFWLAAMFVTAYLLLKERDVKA